jgi:hypothetical protein
MTPSPAAVDVVLDGAKNSTTLDSTAPPLILVFDFTEN